MPIYHKTPPSIVGNHATAEIDNHTSEAAKVKRTREHAYFNSYDFDAIEVLPYDDDDDDDDEEEEEEEEGGKTAANSQKQLKSKTSNQQHSSHTRQHLQQAPKFSYVPSKSQQHPLAALKHANTSSVGHGNTNTCNSDHFIVDKRPHGVAGHPVGPVQRQTHNSYLQRFGVAIFGGISNKSASHHQSASSSATSSVMSTSSSLATDDDNKNIKVMISSELSSTSSSSATFVPSSTTAAVVGGESLNVVVVGGAGGGGVHRDVATKCVLSDNNVVSVVNETTTIGGVAAVTAPPATSSAVAVGPSAGVGLSVAGSAAAAAVAGAAATADGNFLLPRAMLKYQSTPIGSNNIHVAAATATTSMPMATAVSSAATAAAITTHTGSSPTGNSCNKTPTTDGFSTQSTAILKSAANGSNTTCCLKKHSTASSSLSSLGSEEIVEIHQHVDGDSQGPKMRKDFKVLPKLQSGKTPGRAASHQSHYSTDKSASSGYYSSNVCSTYSLEEHIYSEPTIEVKEKSLSGHKESLNVGHNSASVTGGSNSNTKHKPVEDVLPHATLTLAAGAACSGSVMRTLDYNRRYRYTDHNDEIVDATQAKLPAQRASKEFNENLRILESSIENLDRHLKSFPGVISTQDAIVAYAQNPYHGEKMRPYAHLPTIREGYDATAKRVWPEDPATDDSLQDIDLDSFLLDDNKKLKHLGNPPAKGLDNPSFLTEELEENHYKCAKYINSCPEDAYRVESDIIAPTRSSISEQSVDSYPKRYEDQIHFQNTRELLEDVRDKIRLLSLSQDPPAELVVSHKAEQQQARDEYVPKELNTMISTLKRELELYLQRMNQHSELEIRQLCTGLVKNQHIVKMKNAFERRRSLTDVSEQMSSYEAATATALSGGGGPISIRQQITTIKCSSDPNFKMKRKSLTEVFPISECYIETVALGPDTQPPLPAGIVSQLQRNLNFHQPSIHQFEAKADNFDKATPDGSGDHDGRARPSGNDSSESNDKDSILDWHRKKPSIWEMYYGTNRIQQSLLGGNVKKNGKMITTTSTPSPMCYPSSRPESDFTLDLPRAEQLRIKMEKEKKFRQRCRVITTFLSLVFFLLTVMVVSLVLTRGKRMFGSMI